MINLLRIRFIRRKRESERETGEKQKEREMKKRKAKRSCEVNLLFKSKYSACVCVWMCVRRWVGGVLVLALPLIKSCFMLSEKA